MSGAQFAVLPLVYSDFVSERAITTVVTLSLLNLSNILAVKNGSWNSFIC